MVSSKNLKRIISVDWSNCPKLFRIVPYHLFYYILCRGVITEAHQPYSQCSIVNVLNVVDIRNGVIWSKNYINAAVIDTLSIIEISSFSKLYRFRVIHRKFLSYNDHAIIISKINFIELPCQIMAIFNMVVQLKLIILYSHCDWFNTKYCKKPHEKETIWHKILMISLLELKFQIWSFYKNEIFGHTYINPLRIIKWKCFTLSDKSINNWCSRSSKVPVFICISYSLTFTFLLAFLHDLRCFHWDRPSGVAYSSVSSSFSFSFPLKNRLLL